MTRYLSKAEVLELHRWALQAHGGTPGILNDGMLDSALAVPQASFAGTEAYPTLTAKAAAFAYSLVKNHACVDGNKRVCFWATDAFLRLNGFELVCEAAEGATLIEAVAASTCTREQLLVWIESHLRPLTPGTEGQPP